MSRGSWRKVCLTRCMAKAFFRSVFEGKGRAAAEAGAMAANSSTSIWWLRKLSTLSTSASSTMPSRHMRSSNSRTVLSPFCWEVYHTDVPSFTHGGSSTVIVSKRFLGPADRLLLIDDFLANGAALEGLIDLVPAYALLQLPHSPLPFLFVPLFYQNRRRFSTVFPRRRGPGGGPGPDQVHVTGQD